MQGVEGQHPVHAVEEGGPPEANPLRDGVRGKGYEGALPAHLQHGDGQHHLRKGGVS